MRHYAHNSFPPLAPDSVIELVSKHDQFETVRKKMQEYMASGVRLAWLINPYDRSVEIYRPGGEPVTHHNPETISGDPELAGYVLELGEIW